MLKKMSRNLLAADAPANWLFVEARMLVALFAGKEGIHRGGDEKHGTEDEDYHRYRRKTHEPPG